MGSEHCILVVDDGLKMVRTLSMILDLAGYATEFVHSGLAMRTRVANTSYGCVLSDIRMAGVNSVDSVKLSRTNSRTCPLC